MGTSSSRSAPKDNQWKKAKNTLSHYTTKRGMGGITPSNVYSSYVNASGGTRGFSTSSKTGVQTAQRFAGFLGDISSLGFTETLKKEGMEDLVGKSVGEILSGIIDKLAGPGKLLEDAIARSALLEVLAELFERENEEYETISIDSSRLIELLALFIAEYIYQRLLSDLVNKIENKSIDSNEVKNREEELKDFIIKLVRFNLGGKDPLKIDWLGKEGKRLIEENIEVSLGQLEE